MAVARLQPIVLVALALAGAGWLATATSMPARAADAAAPATATTTPATDCRVHYEVTPRYDRSPRVLEVRLSFPAEQRTRSLLRFVPSWAGVDDLSAGITETAADSDGARIALADMPNRWTVDHPAGGRVAVRYTVRPTLAEPDAVRPQEQTEMYRGQLGRDWFQFFGQAVLPSVETWDDNSRIVQCLTLRQPDHPDAPVFGSHGSGTGTLHLRVEGSPGLMRNAFYAGGPGWRIARQKLPSGVAGLAVRGRYEVGDAEFADAVFALIGTHRAFWNEQEAPEQWLVLTPNHTRYNNGGTLVHQAAVMHVPAGFRPRDGGLDFLVAHENLHQWIPRRIGPLQGAATGGGGLVEYWFSEGFTDYYTHRLLLRSGHWDLARYARELTTVLQRHWRSPAREAPAAALLPRFFSDRDAGRQFYARGELLAMRWDRALRSMRHPGLDAVMQGLILPNGAASPAPAVERLHAALSPALGAVSRRDVSAYVDDGRPLPLDEDLAGPCFALTWRDVARWVPGFDVDASIRTRRITGVRPGGPAHAAGVRDGIAVVGWSVHHGDPTREIEMTLQGADGKPGARLRFLPADSSSERLPRLDVRPGAAGDAACVDWQRRDVTAMAAAAQ